MGTSLVYAFESIQQSLPKKLQTDKGTEFLNYKFQQWLKAHKVHHFTMEDEDIKACIVERFNRTLKSKLWRYFARHDTLSFIDVLDSMVDIYNHAPHRSIGMAPNGVTSRNKACIWFRLYADPISYKEPVLHVGDTVRISKARWTFKKGYLERKRSSLSWKERVHNLPRLHWPIIPGKCWKAPFILSNCKRWPKRTTCIKWRNTKENKESSLGPMARLSR